MMPVVNPKVIEELRALSPGPDSTFLVEIIDLFLNEGAAYLARMRQSLETRDPRVIERAAHTLKGSSGNLGVMGMSKLCAELQAAGNAADWTRAAPLVAAIEQEFAQARIELEAEKAKE